MRIAAMLTFLIMSPTAMVVGAIVTTSNTISYCLSPTGLEATVTSESEKSNFPDCTRWSSFFRNSAVVATHEFVKANCAGQESQPVNYFARAVINQFRQNARLPQIRDIPTTHDISNTFQRFGLRELTLGEPRIGSIVVWKGGTIGLVIGDTSTPTEGFDLTKIQILYPASTIGAKSCGILKARDAEAIAATLGIADNERKTPKFLTIDAKRPLYWNYWLESAADQAEQPDSVKLQQWYQFRLSFSSLEFGRLIEGDKALPLSGEDAQTLIPNFDGVKYNLMILPIDPIRDRDGKNGAFTAHFTIDRARLVKSLVDPPSGSPKAFKLLADEHDALRQHDDTAGVTYQFTLSEQSECAALVIIISNAASGEVVSAWTRPLNPENRANPNKNCGDVTTTSRGMDLVALFDYPHESDVAARISFLEFQNRNTVGNMIVMTGNQREEFTWVLNAESLQHHLGRVKKEIDRHIADPDFSIMPKAAEISALLFTCRQDEGCRGQEALARLTQIASFAKSDTRLAVSFRNSLNSVFYLPAQIIALNDSTLLGERLSVTQPLPRHGAKLPASSECTRTWSGGLVVSDAVKVLTTEWRRKWIEPFRARPGQYVAGQFFDDIAPLRQYLSKADRSSVPEALVLAAHHGPEGLSNYGTETSQRQWIRSIDVRRQFDNRSFCVLALCSVGALSEGNLDNSRILDRLNAQNMRAAIVSPFNIPLQLAKSFLDHFQSEVLLQTTDTPLFEIFRRAKTSLRSKPRDGEKAKNIQSAIETFMLLGDGNIKVCKP
jgi:hypothetical protein